MGEIHTVWKSAYETVKRELPDGALSYWDKLPKPSEITDEYFLSELAWCVYNGGMKEAVVRLKWPDIRNVFSCFDPHFIVACEREIPEMIAPIFNHQGKASAVIKAAKKILDDGPIGLKLSTLSEEEALAYLQEYPFIGKITCYHLARNIGFDVVKPDRHLVRLANYFEKTPDELATEMSKLSGFKKGFVDYVLWQWLAWGYDFKNIEPTEKV